MNILRESNNFKTFEILKNYLLVQQVKWIMLKVIS